MEEYVFEWCARCRALDTCYGQAISGPCCLDPDCLEGPLEWDPLPEGGT